LFELPAVYCPSAVKDLSVPDAVQMLALRGRQTARKWPRAGPSDHPLPEANDPLRIGTYRSLRSGLVDWHAGFAAGHPFSLQLVGMLLALPMTLVVVHLIPIAV
jgi:hypothetical protein